MATKDQFARQATGLVRQVGVGGNIVIGLMNASITGGIIFETIAIWLDPGANIALSIVFGGLLFLAGQGITYALYAASMPRSGGDYVFISRTLSPSIGFGGNFCQFWVAMVAVGYSAVFLAFQISDWLVSTGLLANNAALTNLGTSFNTFWGGIIVGLVVTVIPSAVLAILGLKTLVKAASITFYVTVISLVLAIVVLLTVSHSSFVSSFNSFMGPYTHSTNSYQSIITTAQKNGFTVPPFSWSATIAAIPFSFLWINFCVWPVYNGGETKSASDVKKHFLTLTGSVLFMITLTPLLLYLVDQVAGHTLIASFYYLYSTAPSTLPIPTTPYYNLFIGIATRDPLVAGIVGAGIAIAAWGTIVTFFTAPPRMMLAYSFDRIFPRRFSDVSQRFNTPYIAITVVGIVASIAVVIYSIIPSSIISILFLGTTYVSEVPFLLTCIAAIFFVWRRKELFQSSPMAKYRVGRIPLITISGIVGTVILGVAFVAWFTQPAYGISTIPSYEGFLIFMIVVPMVLYYAIRAYRKSRGIDLQMLMKEIPPE